MPKPMTGEIGKLSIDGEQVGGFKYWTAIQNRKTGQTIVRASKFWLLRPVDAKSFEADFYSHNPDGNLKLLYTANVMAELPDCAINKMVDKSIEMNLGLFDWLQETRIAV